MSTFHWGTSVMMGMCKVAVTYFDLTQTLGRITHQFYGGIYVYVPGGQLNRNALLFIFPTAYLLLWICLHTFITSCSVFKVPTASIKSFQTPWLLPVSFPRENNTLSMYVCMPIWRYKETQLFLKMKANKNSLVLY